MKSIFYYYGAALPLFLILLTVAGCAVGPDFKRPAAPSSTNYLSGPLKSVSGTPNVAGGGGQQFVEGLDIAGKWWDLFHSEPLNQLLQRAITNNPDLKAAQAALVVAQENLRAQRGIYYPNISGSFAASRQRQSGFISPTPNANIFEYNLFTPQVSVSYVPDVFGLNRRTVESSKAQAESARFQMVATYLTLSANVVVAAIQEASLRAQIDTTRQLLGISSNMVEIVKYQYTNGYANGLDLAAQQSQLAQIAATLPPLLKQLAQQRDLLAVLAGDFPSDQKGEGFELAKLKLPEELPVTLPSKLVEQRPDILQAEQNLHAASAQVGISIANRLPNITLSASAGSTALSLDKLFNSGFGILDGWWDPGTADFSGRHFAASGACGQGGVRRSGAAISQHGSDGLPECRRYVECVGARRRRAYVSRRC